MKEDILKTMGRVSLDGPTATCEFVFEETFRGFHGHFPGNPVLPGVCFLQCALVLASKVSGGEKRVVLVDSAKFLAAVSPGQSVQATCQLEDDRVVASFAVGEKVVSKLKMRVADA